MCGGDGPSRRLLDRQYPFPRLFGLFQCPSMAYQFCYRRRVEFSETDMAGIMHFSNFFRFKESAESAF